MQRTILVVDDEKSIVKAVKIILEGDYKVHVAGDAAGAMEMMIRHRPDLMLLDIGLPDRDGLEVLSDAKALDPDLSVVMVTAVDRVKTVVQAVKLGAFDYLVKPIDAAELKITVQNALENKGLKDKIRRIQGPNVDRYRLEMIGRSPQIKALLEIAEKVSKSPDTPVLITGKTGVGKGVLARSIHYHDPGTPGPFVAVNATAITHELFESELFGYERGAFTGARSAGKTGYFEKAAGGTLFLDEIGSLSLEDQSKLLGVIEDRTFYRVGGDKPIPVTSRIIAATNMDLTEAVRKGEFREDLFFRLKVVHLHLPPLRERKEDILPLAEHFMRQFNEKMGKAFLRISSEAEGILLDYPWPGNVRELRNTIERIILLENDAAILPTHLSSLSGPAHSPDVKSPASIPQSQEYDEVVKSIIYQALEQSQGNVQEAARILKIPPHKLRYRIKKYGIQVEN